MNGTDFTSRNFKRVAEVWLDDYKSVFYQNDPRKVDIDAGDLTKMKIIRSKLKCKPFDYFLEEIAPEMFQRYFYQHRYPGFFGSGLIKSYEAPDLCLDTLGRHDSKIGLFQCRGETNHTTNSNQYFQYTWHRKLRPRGSEECLGQSAKMCRCRYDGWSHFQDWKYDFKTKQLIYLRDKKCLTSNKLKKTVDMADCKVNQMNQKWIFSNTNEKALRNFDRIYFDHGRLHGMNLI